MFVYINVISKQNAWKIIIVLPTREFYTFRHDKIWLLYLSLRGALKLRNFIFLKYIIQVLYIKLNDNNSRK